jgi:hypothetical protein
MIWRKLFKGSIDSLSNLSVFILDAGTGKR